MYFSLKIIVLSSVGFLGASAIANEKIKDSRDQSGLSPYFFTTAAYQQEAGNILLNEVNLVALELGLAEPTPITKSNLVEVIIQPPASGALGSIATSNYSYCVCIYNQFTDLNRKGMNKIWEKDRVDYLWPQSRINTNAAFLVATQILFKAGMDVAGIMRDCKLDISYLTPEGKNAGSFVPEYWISWFKKDKLVVHLKLFLPTKDVRALSVRDSLYNHRKPAIVTNLIELLKQGHAPQILIDRLSTNILYKGVSRF